MNLEFLTIDSSSGPHALWSAEKIASFLYEHLDQYGDRREDILKALEYVMNPGRGGQLTLGIAEQGIVGAVVINHTGMSGYIPENILVYIAVHRDFRGKGLGKDLMLQAIKTARGNIALHVEPDNPARKLYERLGFTNKYLEMRLIR